MTELTLFFLSLIFGLTGIILWSLRQFFSKNSPSPLVVNERLKIEKSVSKSAPKKKFLSKISHFTHPWLASSLKGHSKRVLDIDFSENGKFLASTSEDGAVLIWFSKDFEGKEHKVWRGNIEFDVGSSVKWSPDNKAFAVLKANANNIEIYKISKNENGVGKISAAFSFDEIPSTEILSFGLSPNGLYLMTCSKTDKLILWNLKGGILTSVDTLHMNINYCAKISPCGRFVATSGFTPDVSVLEIKFSKTGEFIKADKVFQLSGHSAGIYHFSFNFDSSRIVTLSKDGTFRLFDTSVDYAHGQSPKTLWIASFSDVSPSSLIALSPDASIVIISASDTLYFYSASSPDHLLEKISGVHSESIISSVIFHPEGNYIVTSGDKHIRVFHNVPGLQIKISELEEKLKGTKSLSLKERIESQYNEAKSRLSKILEH